MKSSPSLLSSLLLGLNIFLNIMFSNTLLSLCSSALYMYCPIWMPLILEDLHIMLLSLFELRENKRREDPTFLSVCFLWRCCPTRAMASSFLRFQDHTQRRITVGRTPLDEWSARRRDLYLITHNTQNRQTSMPQVGFEPTIAAGEGPQTYALDRAATGTGTFLSARVKLYIILFGQTLVHFESKELLGWVRALWHWVRHLQCLCNRDSPLSVRYELSV